VLHAWNDPVVPPIAIPKQYFKNNPRIIFAATRSGGHTGWMEGLFVGLLGLTWAERVSSIGLIPSVAWI
jgi:predicted alpha/beta-fold hydrolase